MIVSAGLTPAWQHVLRFAQLVPDGVNRATEVHWCASGKNVNAALALEALGADVIAIAPLGGWSGRALADELTRRQMRARWSATDTPTRVCTTLVDDANHTATELVENAAALTETEQVEFFVAYREVVASADAVVLTGSLPPETPATFYRDLLKVTKCPVVLDARGPELLAALECRPRVVKPNREELARTLGRTLPGVDDLRLAMGELIERGAQAVVVTEGKDAVWVADANRFWRLTPPTVEPVVNAIGSGDCLAGGLAYGLGRGMSLEEAIHVGMAAAAENVRQLLPARLSLRGIAEMRRKVAG